MQRRTGIPIHLGYVQTYASTKIILATVRRLQRSCLEGGEQLYVQLSIHTVEF